AERPEDLVVYGGAGEGGPNWGADDASVRTPRSPGGDETMLVQSRKPGAGFRAGPPAPPGVSSEPVAASQRAGRETVWGGQKAGLTMYGQMTAGSWIYIGTQGILQGTYETLAECATQHFGGTLRGRVTVTAGLGGMGGAQPLAVTMNDGVALCIDVDPTRIER